nr:SH3 domain-containing protein 2-like [Ipomoea batatas]
MPTFFRPGQAIEVSRRQAKARESNGNPDYMSKLESAETKLHELKSNMGKLGKEASAAMAAVEAQQQRLTLQRLIAMVEAEYSYHQRVLQILDQLEAEERHGNETVPNRPTSNAAPPPPPYNEASSGFSSQAYDTSADGASYFLGEVMHPYRAESDVELTLSVGDYIVVRKVLNNGWAEGECKGKAGWFPVGYVERRERVLASKVAEVF